MATNYSICPARLSCSSCNSRTIWWSSPILLPFYSQTKRQTMLIDWPPGYKIEACHSTCDINSSNLTLPWLLDAASSSSQRDRLIESPAYIRSVSELLKNTIFQRMSYHKKIVLYIYFLFNFEFVCSKNIGLESFFYCIFG